MFEENQKINNQKILKSSLLSFGTGLLLGSGITLFFSVKF